MEPTGPAWLPIAVFFASRGHAVFRVSSQKASDLRKFFSKHAKTNGIDADTLARLGIVDPAGLIELRLPDAPGAALDRRVRAELVLVSGRPMVHDMWAMRAPNRVTNRVTITSFVQGLLRTPADSLSGPATR